MSLAKVRNIGIAAHIDAGKTTVTERILFFTGVNRKVGETHDGQATTDFMKQEQERGITIASAAISATWNSHNINLIDTPGHVDFTVEVERSLRVIDGMIAVFCAVGGVEPQSETVWNQADKYRVPRIAFINKMDRVGADFLQVVDQMNKYLDAKACVFQIPIGREEDFTGIIDIIRQKAYIFEEHKRIETEIPEDYLEAAAEGRSNLIETIANYNDDIANLFLEEAEISEELLVSAARDATNKLLITPVFCGAAYKNKGIQLLLDAVVDFLPSPLDIGSILGTDYEDPEKSVKIVPSVNEPLAALAFKLINDPYVGQQTFVRIFAGEIKSGMQFYNTAKRKHERAGRIFKIRAKDRAEIPSASAGDIVSIVGLKVTKTGDTLCSDDAKLFLESIDIPPAVIEMKVLPKAKKESEKLGIALSKLSNEDPSFRAYYDNETEETIIAGMGELHLEIIVDRLKHEFKVDAEVGEPAVSFRETINSEIDTEYKHIKQSGGKGQYAHVIMRLEPNKGNGYEFVNNIKGGNIPTEYISSVNKGIEKAMNKGPLSNFPVIDVKVVLIDGSYHAVDSSDMAFQICAEAAFKKAFVKADPVILEPYMKIEVNTPDDFIGNITGDFSKRRGKIDNMRRYRKGSQKLNGFVPLMEVFGYATSLRNISSGRANYSMEFQGYRPVPANIQEQIIKDIEESNK